MVEFDKNLAKSRMEFESTQPQCKDSCLPDNGTILQSATTFLNIENLDTAQ